MEGFFFRVMCKLCGSEIFREPKGRETQRPRDRTGLLF